MFLLILSMMSFQSGGFDAMITWRANKMYAFAGNKYYRYDLTTNKVDAGYPKYIQGNWAGLPFQRIDAAVNWQNGKAYFFSGNMYVRYDINTDRMDPGYPQYISSTWRLPWNKVDAAFYRGNNKAYLFNNASGQYVRYDVVTNAPDPGYPKMTATYWPPMTKVDAGEAYYNKMYLSVDTWFYRMDMTTNKFESGYPKVWNHLPDVASRRSSTNPPPPPVVNNRPPPPTNNTQTGGNTINGTLAYARGGAWIPWNNVQVQLQQANGYFNQRYQAYANSGYTPQQALSAMVKEDNLWNPVTSSTTKPAQYQSSKYGMSYSWFGFVGVGKGYYRVFVAGYPQLNRWVNFPGSNQKIAVELEYRE